jgi:biopolymer transport protein ExbD
MKLENKNRGHFDSGPNLIPMVNIAMVVLIVFMIGVSFAGPELFIQSNVPIAAEGAAGEPPPGMIPDEPLEIRVDVDPRFPDQFIAVAGRIQTSNARELADGLKAMHMAMNQAGTPTDRIRVQISPGRNVKYRFLIEVYQAALQADFEKIGFTTSR